ncbi:MAG: hypothetical protein FGF52_03885 [Candidatus Brockarchaeota archaeon]|nr:hypothetical protein [Candidatus Brockarchaeota archaeon]
MSRLQKLLEEALKATLEESKGLEITKAIPKANKLDMRRLKDFALKSLPEDSKLKALILSEKDEISVEEFLAKMSVWLKLLALES